MRILVTGASGFLGSRLARQLVQNNKNKVSILIRRNSNTQDLGDISDFTIIYGDLNDHDSLRSATKNIDTIIHSAARVNERGTRDQFIQENVLATKTLLSSARANGAKRFIFISSPSALMQYHGGDQINIDESIPYPIHFLNYYCETKAEAEKAVLAENCADFMTCALRPRAIWGPGDRSGPIIRLLARAQSGKLPNLSGGRDVYASLCHVDNIVHACILAVESKNVAGKAYFIADSERTNIWPFMSEVAQKFGFSVSTKPVNLPLVKAAVSVLEKIWKIPYLAKNYSPPLSRYALALVTRSATFDISAAQNDFGYSPIIKRELGLQDFKVWVDTQGGISTIAQGLN
ncbi:MAG: NAD-dependent epimerase/dehydratase family protein [Mycobacteriaceae bacterium]